MVALAVLQGGQPAFRLLPLRGTRCNLKIAMTVSMQGDGADGMVSTVNLVGWSDVSSILKYLILEDYHSPRVLV